MSKRLTAFKDGVITGGDLIGSIRGHVSGCRLHSGYVADQYSSREMRKILEFSGYQPKPIERSLDEQACKAFGDVVGLALSPFTQLFFLEKSKQRSDISRATASLTTFYRVRYGRRTRTESF